jgi:hypothetical protein
MVTDSSRCGRRVFAVDVHVLLLPMSPSAMPVNEPCVGC